MNDVLPSRITRVQVQQQGKGFDWKPLLLFLELYLNLNKFNVFVFSLFFFHGVILHFFFDEMLWKKSVVMWLFLGACLHWLASAWYSLWAFARGALSTELTLDGSHGNRASVNTTALRLTVAR